MKKGSSKWLTPRNHTEHCFVFSLHYTSVLVGVVEVPGGQWMHDPNHSCMLRFWLLHALMRQAAVADLRVGTVDGRRPLRLDGWKRVEVLRIDIPVRSIGT